MWWKFVLACRPHLDPLDPLDTQVTGTIETGERPTEPLFDVRDLVPRPPRNVLIVSIDTTRRDYIDRYATDGVTRTPFLAQLLSEGLALDDHQQCSNWTYASTSCTLEGQRNEETDWIANIGAESRTLVPDGRRTLAVRLAEQGWYSILISSNTWLSDDWNNAQGYDAMRREWTADSKALLDVGRNILEAAISIGEDRWLLHVHLLQAHPAYLPPDPYDDEAQALPPLPDNIDIQSTAGQYEAADNWPVMTPDEQALLLQHLEARYTGELRFQDDQLAAWWSEMDAAGFLDDTLVIFWTDHGEQFFEHGHQSHAFTLGAEENDGILGFWSKGMTPMAVSGPTHATDLVPTTLALLGVTPEPGDPLEGYVVGTAPSDRARFASSVGKLGPVLSVTKEGVKLQYSFDGSVHLWDRNTDRKELVDLYRPDHPLVSELWSLLLPKIVRVSELTPLSPLVWPPGLPH